MKYTREQIERTAHGTLGKAASMLRQLLAENDAVAQAHKKELDELAERNYKLKKDNDALRESVRKANAQAEHFEREWYLRGDALESIALAGMSGSGQESEEGMRDWHARRAWEFIGIAARALDTARKPV